MICNVDMYSTVQLLQYVTFTAGLYAYHVQTVDLL